MYGNQVKTDSVTTTYTSEVYPLGSIYVQPADEVVAGDATLKGPRVWVFIKATAAIAANVCVARQTTGFFDGQTAGAAAPAITLLGVTAHAIDSGSYGWVVKQGCLDITSGDAIVAGTPLMTVASGKVDDTALAAGNSAMVLGYQLEAASAGDELKAAYVSIP
jgi:hypothetical protein